MTKKDLLNARESLQENMRTYLDGLSPDTEAQICQIIVDSFTPLLEKESVTRSIVLTQAGDKYRTERATNFLDIRMGMSLEKAEVEKMIADGIRITVQRNK
jgi:hypothetical protein